MVDAVAGEAGAGATPPPQLVPLDIPSNAAPGPDAAPEQAPAPVMTKEEFFQYFVSAFAFAGSTFHAFAKVELPTLYRVHTLPHARPASDTLYDTLSEIGVLAWFNENHPMFKWVQRIAVLYLFGQAVASGVRADLAAHAARNVTPKAAGA